MTRLVIGSFFQYRGTAFKTFELVSAAHQVSHIFQLPSRISDSEIPRLASLFSESTLNTVSILYFGFTWDDVKNLRADNIQDAALFNIGLFTSIRNKFPERKVILFQL